MNSKTTIAALLGLGMVGALVLASWYVWQARPPAFCEISARPIHSNMHARVKVDGKRFHACCPRCALTLAVQAHRRIEILTVTDFVSARQLRAADAHYVDGSQVEVCTAPRLRVDESRTPYVRLFDRCSPSLLAFAREEEARDFVAHYGGSLKTLEDLIGEVTSEPTPTGEHQHD